MEKLTKSPRLNHYLYQMELYSFYDVVNYLPYRYESFLPTIEKGLEDKQRVVLVGEIISFPKLVRSRKIDIVTFEFMTINRTYFKVVAYNRSYLVKNLLLKEKYTLVGSYSKKNNEINLVNIQKGVVEEKDALKALYHLPSGFQNYLFHNLVNKGLEELKGHIYSLVPYSYQNKYRLVSKEKALQFVHNPKNAEEIRQAYRYLKYEEALTFSLKNQIIQKQNKSLKKIKKEPIDLTSCEEFLKTLPYTLTEDQKVASEEIIEDMNQSSLMYRLLQGDVGTGKTLVCFIALFANYKRGDQGALMAPTDVLARQHYQNALKLFKDTKLRIALLLGSTPTSEKKQIYQDLEDGYIDLVIGTHALFTKSVQYSSLGLVIIDEQHRFGVNQRQKLLEKGDHADLLMMSATPIPRSLALSIYGDLAISTLTSFPNKARDVSTFIVNSEDEIIYKKCQESIDTGHKVYVVAPLIEYHEEGKYSAEGLFTRFVLHFGKKVAILHGKMKNNEKEEVIEQFANGGIDILVSTQVIEVGVDIKKANLMIIYDASSFGLASLHQLRGRIGRNSEHADCFLTYDDEDEEAKEKLDILVKSNDGFEIAEKDLSMRGPGELTGLKQSGLPNFQFLNIVDDIKIFITARDDARKILADSNNKEFKYLISKCEKDILFNPVIKA